MGIGTNIKRLLAIKKMTIKELSQETGIPINTLYSITRRDSASTRTEYLGKIAKALNVGIDELINIAAVSVTQSPEVFWENDSEIFNYNAKSVTPKDIADVASTLTRESLELVMEYALERADFDRYKAAAEKVEP